MCTRRKWEKFGDCEGQGAGLKENGVVNIAEKVRCFRPDLNQASEHPRRGRILQCLRPSPSLEPSPDGTGAVLGALNGPVRNGHAVIPHVPVRYAVFGRCGFHSKMLRGARRVRSSEPVGSGGGGTSNSGGGAA